MSVRRKIPPSDQAVRAVADASNLPVEYVREQMKPIYTEVQRIVFDESGEPQVKVTTCCCKAPGGIPRICARVAGYKTPCRCNCHRKAI